MPTRVATALAQGSASQAAEDIVAQLKQKLEGDEPALIAYFASTTQPLSEVAAHIKKAFPDATAIGSSTAGEFTEATRNAKNAISAFALAGDYKVFAGIGRSLKEDVEAAVGSAVDGLPKQQEGLPHRTAILLLDPPLAGNGEEAVLVTAGHLGDPVRLAGGAAGDDLKMAHTEVACGEDVATNALVVATIFSKVPLGVGVAHGHQPLSTNLEITKAKDNVVYEIDGRPAWAVWAEKTREAAVKAGLDPDNLGDDQVGGYLLRYEAGLANGSQYKIRAPLSKGSDGSLSFACGIPQGAVIRITESEPARQVDSAREAARRAKEQISGADVAGALVFDCICRNLILDAQFSDAVESISQELGNVPLAGFETYGEIALDVGDMSGFHNTTTVLLAFPK